MDTIKKLIRHLRNQHIAPPHVPAPEYLRGIMADSLLEETPPPVQSKSVLLRIELMKAAQELDEERSHVVRDDKALIRAAKRHAKAKR